MSRKAKRAPKGKKPAPTVAPLPTGPADALDAPEKVAAGLAEWVGLVGAIIVVVGVGLWFQLNVNRVFDVPKAVVLKVGGCTLFAAWLAYGLFGPGVRWRSARVFAPPVAALAVVVMISTALSVDVSTSFNGVYERQFGLQGFLACVGLFFVTATSLSGKRGAWVAIAVLAMVGSSMGIYALFQAFGMDPWPFFWNRPHNKVYAFLGNATFAGNALALILPMVTVSGGVATAVTIGATDRRDRIVVNLLLWAAGFVGFLLVQIAPGYFEATAALSLDPVPARPPPNVAGAFKIGLFLGPATVVAAALLGTWGPEFTRLVTKGGRQAADAFAAGGLMAMVVGIIFGLLFTRTRGAWVGTFIAFSAGVVLLPILARGTRSAPLVRALCWGPAAVAVAALSFYVVAPAAVCGTKTAANSRKACWVYAETIRSIPAAFDPNRTDYGKGQGTRRFLWTESPRVLVNHSATLERYYQDRTDYAAHVEPSLAENLEIAIHEAPSDSFMSFDTAWRSAVVWLFGIGIETYRYAFMSHKSMRLEALDPMTNHDNPHNNYLYVLASFGLAGLLAYLWLMGTLLWESFRRFIAPAQPLLTKHLHEHQPGLVTRWQFMEANRDPKGKLLLETDAPEAVQQSIGQAQPDWQTEEVRGGIIVRKYDPDAVLDELTAINASRGGQRIDRAMAFGVLTSFFSYSVYSIAGFDSVACSVFLFFLLGAAAALFRPNHGEPVENLLVKVRRQWSEFRGEDPEAVSGRPPVAAAIVLAAIMIPLLLVSAGRSLTVLSAERALVNNDKYPASTQQGIYEAKISRAADAVRENPAESFYKQTLGNAYGEAALFYDAQARSVQNSQPSLAAAARAKAQDYRKKGEQALYAALDHAWAPENIYISLFQLYYRQSRLEEAEQALERALVHSPHLGAVRANLASLQLQRNALEEAEANARWVIKVDPYNTMARRVAGRIYQLQGKLKAAEHHLKQAVRTKRDRLAQRYLNEVIRMRTSSTTGS